MSRAHKSHRAYPLVGGPRDGMTILGLSKSVNVPEVVEGRCGEFAQPIRMRDARYVLRKDKRRGFIYAFTGYTSETLIYPRF